MIKEIEVVVRGRVQMVMYRDFTQRKARGLGLSGTVQNRSDGSVYIEAQGEEKDLDTFIKKLEKGSVISKVDSVTITKRDNLGNYRGFSIIF